MPQSLAKVIVHITYSTKLRKPWLHDPRIRSELYAYNATVRATTWTRPPF